MPANDGNPGRRCPNLAIELGFSKRHVTLIEEGADTAIHIGFLTDSSLRARQIGVEPTLRIR